MLSEKSIKEFAIKLQTNEVNVAREYFQHLFLSHLYKIKNSDKIAFKGGTALRIIHASPRFSEDLDFNSTISIFHLNNLLSKSIDNMRLEGLDIEVVESKETSGGYIAVYKTPINGYNVRVEINISLRQKTRKILTEVHLITPSLCPPYTLVALQADNMIK